MLTCCRSGSVQSVSTAGVSEMTIGSGHSGNTDTGTGSNQWQTVGNSDNQTPSCRALAGSLASFEVGNIGNMAANEREMIATEGVPLLLKEEAEFETNSNAV